MSPFSSKSVWRKKVKITGTFGHGDEDRGAIEASRSDGSGASQMMTRRGVKGEAPPARHHRAIADAPPGMVLPRLSRQHLFITC